MWFLYDNVVAVQVAIVSCVFAWLFGGSMGDMLTPVMPWLWVALVELMLCFPQRHMGETTYEARSRVWEELKSDPLFWVVVGFLGLLMVPFVNTGLCPICDYAAIAIDGADPRPMIPFAPYCVNRLEHLNVVMWFVPSLTAMLAVRHSLLKRGKRMVLELIVWNGVALAALGFVQQVTGAEAPFWISAEGRPTYFFSTFGYPNMGGDYFTTLFALAVGLWRWKCEVARTEEKNRGHGRHVKDDGANRHTRFWRRHFMLVPAVMFFFSALTTLSRASIMLVSILAMVFFMHTFMCAFVRLERARRVKASAFSLLALLGIALCTVVFMPEDMQKEVDSINTTAVLDRVTGKGQYHVRVATEVWKDNLLFGCGGWGYKHFSIPKMTEKELRELQSVGGTNVHNDHLQFLAEHGLVGFGCLVAMVVLLISPVVRVWRALLTTVRFTPPKEQPPKPVSIFVLPAPAFCIYAAAVATVVHAFGDCPLRSPAVLSLFFISLAAVDGFLPKIQEK